MLLKIGKRPDHGFDQPLGVLSDCHRRIEHFLEVLAAIARDVAGGPLDSSQRSQLQGALTYFAVAAPRHTADEEESLFPRLRAATGVAAERAGQLIERLEQDHDQANDHHAAVERLVRAWLEREVLPEPDLAELRQRLAALKSLYDAHIRVEDAELFPLAAAALPDEQLREVGREMALRRTERPDAVRRD